MFVQTPATAIFTQKTGITIKVLAGGTGQALDAGRRGDACVVFVHAKSAELRFVAEGQGVKRFPVMYNDFVLIGPKNDPAGVRGMKDVAKALQMIKDKQAPFISRGDRSGTHLAELALWNKDVGSRHREGKGTLVQVGWCRHGRDAQYGERERGLRVVRPRHLDCIQEQG